MEISVTSSLEELLNAYIADEYFAALQYKMAIVVAKGKALDHSTKVFLDNGDEEDEHFDEIVEYAQSLNIPLQINPSQMATNCTTPYVELTDGDSTAQLVSLLIASEKRAIEGYETGLKNETVISQHPELTQFFGEILLDERQHLKELEDLKGEMEASPMTVAVTEPIEINTSNMTDTISTFSDNPVEQTFEESIKKSPYIDMILEHFDGNKTDFVKTFLNFIDESEVSSFADCSESFDSELARETSPYEDRACTHKFIELIDDGIISTDGIFESIIEHIDESTLKNFYVDMCSTISTEKMVISEMNESTLSFHDLFKKTIS